MFKEMFYIPSVTASGMYVTLSTVMSMPCFSDRLNFIICKFVGPFLCSKNSICQSISVKCQNI